MYNMRHTSPIVLIHDHHGGRRHTTAAIVPHSRLYLAVASEFSLFLTLLAILHRWLKSSQLLFHAVSSWLKLVNFYSAVSFWVEVVNFLFPGHFGGWNDPKG